jgi:ParB-like chromosome segregation protein Spo0J
MAVLSEELKKPGGVAVFDAAAAGERSAAGFPAHGDVPVLKDGPVRVPIASLQPADSPRLTGEDPEHVRLLAAIADRLPPITVHRPTMRVVDGMHRLKAALLRGQGEIWVEYVEGSDEDAFCLSVRANVTHGLPLSPADREGVAIRIIRMRPHWSNRAIAEFAGLSAPTVGMLRDRTTEKHCQLNTRVGRDGRVRPLDGTSGRLRASEVIGLLPDASLREIARKAGISVGTARDVRERLRRGEDPVLSRRAAPAGSQSVAADADTKAEPDGIPPQAAARMLDNLRKDPSMRYSEIGRSLLQWLGVYAVSFSGEDALVQSLPEHCRRNIADLAWGCVAIWKQLAVELEQGQ